MRFKHILIVTILLLSFANETSILFAQEDFQVRRITTDDGLNNRNVNQVVQSSDGRMWIGTNNGLQLYDGSRFFNIDQVDHLIKMSETAAWEMQIHQDSFLLIRLPNHFIQLNISSLNMDILDTMYTHIVPNSEMLGFKSVDDRLYMVVNADKTSYLVLNEKGSSSIIDSTMATSPFSTVSIFEERDKIIWLSHNTGVRIIDKFNHQLDRSMTGFEFAMPGLLDKEGNLYISAPTAIEKYIYPYKEQSLLKSGNFDYGFNINFLDNSGYKWLIGRSITRINDDNVWQDLSRVLDDMEVPYANTMMEDNAGNFWISTRDGIIILSENKNLFHSIFKSNSSLNETRAIVEGLDSSIYFKVHDYFIRLGQNNQIDTIFPKLNGKKMDTWTSYYPMYFDNKFNRTWFTNEELGLGYLSFPSGEVNKALDIPHSSSILLDDGRILAGFYLLDMMLYDPKIDSSYALELDSQLETIPYITHFNQTKNGHIWISTTHGLYYISLSGKLLDYYTIDTELAIPNDHVFMTSEESNGRIWGGTRGSGIFRLDQKMNSVTTYNVIDGLSNQMVPAILPYRNSHLILGTFDGLSIFNKNTKAFQNFYTEDGLSHNEFNRNSFLLGRDSTYYFGGLNGVNAFRPEDLILVDTTSNLCLIQFQKYNSVEDSLYHVMDQNNLDDPVIMRPSDDWFEFDFALTNYQNPSKNLYHVMLEGYEPDWRPIIGEGKIRYAGLNPGKYRLRIKAANPNRIWQADEIQIPVKVIPAFYKTWWFIASVILLIAGFVYGWINRIRNENIRLENEVAIRTKKLKGNAQLKNRFFANISHELRTPLTLILSPLKRAQKNTENNSELSEQLNLAVKNAGILQGRINELLDLSKLEHGKLELEKQAVDLVQFLQAIGTNFASLMDQKGIEYQFDNQLGGEEWFTFIDKRKFEKIAFNLIHNAIKFTPDNGSIALRLGKNDSLIQIDVEDSGRGILPEDIDEIFDRYFQTNSSDAPLEGGTGIGLALVKEFTELMGGHVSVKSELDKGSSFSLYFPFLEIEKPRSINLDDQISLGNNTNENNVILLSNNGKSLNPARPNILIVEDHPELRSYLEKILGDHYNIQSAENGQVALNHLLNEKGHNIDLILSDVMMPEMDGFELLKKVKAQEKFRKLPFCFLTAKAGVENKINAYRLGIDDYLLKPFDEAELMARINNLLANAKERKRYTQEASDENDNEIIDDRLFIKIQEIAIENLENPQLSIDFLAEQMNMAPRTFYRTIQKETGFTPNALLKEIRLLHARTLLEESKVTSVSELSIAIGFQSPKYFAKLYKDRFGKAPAVGG